MNLELFITHPTLKLSSAAPTVIGPGEPYLLKWRLTAEQPVQLLGVEWAAGAQLPPLPPAGPPGFPYTLAAGELLELDLQLSPALHGEGFGWVNLALRLRPDGAAGEQALEWRHWLSVFPRESTGEGPALSGPHRGRLIGVVNADAQNGHIFLADYLSFFREYLHLDIPESIAGQILEGLGIPTEDLPLSEEDFLDIARGAKSFFGLDRLELLPEEEGEECEDCYEFEHLAEQAPGEVDVF